MSETTPYDGGCHRFDVKLMSMLLCLDLFKTLSKFCILCLAKLCKQSAIAVSTWAQVLLKNILFIIFKDLHIVYLSIEASATSLVNPCLFIGESKISCLVVLLVYFIESIRI